MHEDIENLKQGKLSSRKNIDNYEKESNKGSRIDMIDDKKSDERDQTWGRKSNGVDSKISENDEID